MENSDYLPLEKLYEGRESIIYRATRVSDQKSVIIKTSKSDKPSAREIAQLVHQYEIVKDLNLDGIVKAIALESSGAKQLLILEDSAGQSLSSILEQRAIGLEEGLEIAIKLSDAVGQLHRKGIMHKDLKPHNVIYNQEQKIVKLTDFGIASRLQQTESLQHNRHFEGTLAYTSPEQTGRMNRVVDQRSDLYSLGVTFYQLFTHFLPFQGKDALELVHSHIARSPTPPHELNPHIPVVLSQIILKLLSKSSEDRYQQAEGLKADLQLCLERLQQQGEIAIFPLGVHDLAEGLRIPQKLYGREEELQILLDAFERVSAGPNEFVLVSGYSGVGKSALINEIQKPIVRQRSFFIKGKFDQTKRDIPYASLLQALQELVEQVGREPAERIAGFKEQLEEQIGNNLGVLIEVLPSLEQLVGPRPSPNPLSPSESQARFNRTLLLFLSVFAQAEHPLVLFLDDLQWTDIASLRCLHYLLSQNESKHLLLIGAYRDNEVTAGHPLGMIIDELKTQKLAVSAIHLKPLGPEEVRELIGDTFQASPEASDAFAQVIHDKTHGNPFFINQFLKTLHDDRIVVFSREQNAWQWDLGAVQNALATDNVVEFMVNKLQRLQSETQNALMRAACIGNRFDLHTLAVVSESSLANTLLVLQEAFTEGLVLPLSDDIRLLQSYLVIVRQTDNLDDLEEFNTTCRFLHDRVQQAAYSLMPERARQEMHHSIGRLMLANTTAEQLDEHIFEIANHLNHARQHLEQPDERIELCKLNLRAAQRAHASSAFDSALSYVRIGLELLPAKAWEEHYELSRDLYLISAISESISGSFERGQELFDLQLKQLNSKLDKSEVYLARLEAYNKRVMIPEAARCIHEALTMLGIEMPYNEEQATIAVPKAIAEIDSLLKDRTSETIFNAPDMEDPEKVQVLRLLMNWVSMAYNVGPNMFAFTTLEPVRISLIYGNSPLAGLIYGAYGVFTSRMTGDFHRAYQFAELGLRLNERAQVIELSGRAKQSVVGYVYHWIKPYSECFSLMQEAYLECLEAGDTDYAGYSAVHLLILLYMKGTELQRMLIDVQTYGDFLLSTNNMGLADIKRLFNQMTLALLGRLNDPTSFNSELFNEKEFLASQPMDVILTLFGIQRVITLTILEEYEQVLSYIELIDDNPMLLDVMPHNCEYRFFQALTYATLYATASQDQQAEYLEKLHALLRNFQLWNSYNPANFAAKTDLIAAEIARIEQRFDDATLLYDRAIDAAEEHRLRHIEALANEFAARFYLQRGRKRIAQMYLSDAYNRYLQWGALAKLQQLDRDYAEVLEHQSGSRGTSSLLRQSSSQATTSRARGELLDMASVIKAGQILASEMVLDELLAKLMQIMLEGAGAQKGALLLVKGAEVTLDAEMSLDPDQLVLHLGDLNLQYQRLPISIIRFAQHQSRNLVIHNATKDGRFAHDPYIIEHEAKSIACLQLVSQGRQLGLIYLENKFVTHVFSNERLEILNLLASQAAIALENAQFFEQAKQTAEELRLSYERLQQEMEERQIVEQQRASLQEEIIHAQKSALAELSTPLIPITEQIVIMPLVGTIDSQRADQIMEALLNGTVNFHAKIVIIDITGVPVVDTAVASSLLQSAHAIRLLGAHTFISGIRPEVAQTLVGLGVDMSSITTQGTLQSSIAYALKLLATNEGKPNGASQKGLPRQQAKAPLQAPYLHTNGNLSHVQHHNGNGHNSHIPSNAEQAPKPENITPQEFEPISQTKEMRDKAKLN